MSWEGRPVQEVGCSPISPTESDPDESSMQAPAFVGTEKVSDISEPLGMMDASLVHQDRNLRAIELVFRALRRIRGTSSFGEPFASCSY